MLNQLMPGLRLAVLLTVLTGLVYPGVVTAICRAFFPGAANGSLITHNGAVVGSALLGQSFTRPEYFHPRPSAGNYDASASGGSNLGPTSQKLVDRIAAQRGQQATAGQIPADLLTTSASGLDPHISPASAQTQLARVASARGTTPEAIAALLATFVEPRDLGLLGEPRVNVLRLNLALDDRFPLRK